MAKRDVMLEELLHDVRLQELSGCAAAYGVCAAVMDYGADTDIADGGYFIVGGLGDFPDLSANGHTPKELEEQIHRNDELFYPKFCSIEITKQNIDTVVGDFMEYCARAEILNSLFHEFGCPIPDVIRDNELDNLIDWNFKRSNQDYPVTLRGLYNRNLVKFFENEKRMLEGDGYQEFMKYLRSDRYDGDMYEPKQDYTYFKMKGQQEIPLSLLQHTMVPVVKTIIPEEDYQTMKDILTLTPYVFYSVGEKIVSDYGRPADPEMDPWKNEERYFESRVLYYKDIDEAEVASAWIRAHYAYAMTKDSIMNKTQDGKPLRDRPVARYVAYGDMEKFIEEAERCKLKFTFDFGGVLLTPNFHQIPIVVDRRDATTLSTILFNIDKKQATSHYMTDKNMKYDQKPSLEEIIEKIHVGTTNVPEIAVAGPNFRDEPVNQEVAL